LIAVKTTFFFLALSLILGLSLAHGNETITVNKSFNGREIKVKVGSTIRVELEHAGATGYTWEIKDLDKEHLEVASIMTPEPLEKRDIVGGPVKKIWLIRAKTKGKCELKFIYFRPWEGAEKTADTFVMKVRVL